MVVRLEYFLGDHLLHDCSHVLVWDSCSRAVELTGRNHVVVCRQSSLVVKRLWAINGRLVLHHIHQTYAVWHRLQIHHLLPTRPLLAQSARKTAIRNALKTLTM